MGGGEEKGTARAIKQLSSVCAQVAAVADIVSSLFKLPIRSFKFIYELQRHSVSKHTKWTEIGMHTAAV